MTSQKTKRASEGAPNGMQDNKAEPAGNGVGTEDQGAAAPGGRGVPGDVGVELCVSTQRIWKRLGLISDIISNKASAAP
ncbi:MAG: hypothetical protein U0X20_22260 [Caldilineaceae bacterium]